jgi:hypothetical protein
MNPSFDIFNLFAAFEADLRRQLAQADDDDREATAELGGVRLDDAMLHIADAALALLPDEPPLPALVTAHYGADGPRRARRAHPGGWERQVG